jgi:hypothetical protein
MNGLKFAKTGDRESDVRRLNQDDVRNELNRLMQEHIESLQTHTFVAPTDKQFRETEDRLKRIRELSSEYLIAMKKSAQSKMEGEGMPEKPSVTLPAKVEKILEPTDDSEPQKAQIAIEGADPLYREIRIENSLKDEDGEEVRLKENDEVDVTVEANADETTRTEKSTAEQSRQRRAS